MPREVILFTGQWTDLELDEACALISSMGYDGVELSAWGGHFDLFDFAHNPSYAQERKVLLDDYGLSCRALSAELFCSYLDADNDKRNLGNIKPDKDIRTFARDQLIHCAKAARAMGADVVTGYMKNPFFTDAMDDFGKHELALNELVELWSPILDAYESEGIKLAIESSPFDYYGTKALFEAFKNKSALGLALNPGKLTLNMLDPAIFMRGFMDKIAFVRMTDVKLSFFGKGGVIGSPLPLGNTERGWNIVSPGHGSVDFDAIIRELNSASYDGPLCVTHQDVLMDRDFAATEACAFVKKLNFC